MHEPGTLTWIRGASGSGKSTLLRVISGLQKPTSGTVSIFGHDLWSSSARNRDRLRAKSMGIVFQDSGVVPCLTIDENLSFAQGLSGATADSDANSVMSMEFLDTESNGFLDGESR
ncbi:ATP-binding cassette domain-containing protein [Corynebacterium sp. LaCa117]|uniref:ATP-binding cassette domain-containing protein n=1 Tax=Corynebacterium sp. LaCa117 TaxID=3391424 RepID=UPI003988C91B